MCSQFGWPLAWFIGRYCVVLEGEFIGRTGKIIGVVGSSFLQLDIFPGGVHARVGASDLREVADPSSTAAWEAMLLERTVMGELLAGISSAS
eukprot:4973281-Pyramimonas_sp.AAC.1